MGEVKNFSQKIRVETQHSSHSGGGSDGMEPRIAVLEAEVRNIKESVGEIKTEIRGMRNWSFGMFLFLISGMTGGFFWLAEKIDKVTTTINAVQIQSEKTAYAVGIIAASESAQRSPPVTTHDPKSPPPSRE